MEEFSTGMVVAMHDFDFNKKPTYKPWDRSVAMRSKTTTENTGMDSQKYQSAVRQRQYELDQIRDALKDLRFGALNIIVQDGVVVQIERTEKRRLTKANSNAPSSPTAN